MQLKDATPPTKRNETRAVDRRDFFKKALSTIIGGVVGLVPLAAGLITLLDPLRRKEAAGGAIKVTSLDALPADGIPRKFPVIATKVDAWNTFKDVPVGAVYLRRTGKNTVEALNVVCPHAGCFVDLSEKRDQFHCPCHNSSFALNGTIADPQSPSPRALDSLPAEIRNGGEVWVTFQNFKAAEREKIPVS